MRCAASVVVALGLTLLNDPARGQQILSRTIEPTPDGDKIVILFGGPPRSLAPVVTAAPYSAVQVTDHVQSIAGGGHISHRENLWILYRDGMGRRRMETPIRERENEEPYFTIVEIRDFVGGYEYTLDPVNKIAHRMKLPPPQNANLNARPLPSTPIKDAPRGRIISRTESLGNVLMEGLPAQGKKVTTTIPAGMQGNDVPVTYTTESWYSPDLKMSVLTKQEVPGGRVITTKLTNIRPFEPDPALFQVPANYKIVDEESRFTIEVLRGRSH